MISEGLDALKNMASDMNEVSFVKYIPYNRLPLFSILADEPCHLTLILAGAGPSSSSDG